MKRNILKKISFACLIALFTLGFNACKDDSDCRLKVIVKDVKTGNARIVGAKISIGKGSSNVKPLEEPQVDGSYYSDANGEAFFTYEMEAIWDINVEYYDSVPPAHLRIGKATVRLKAGELVEQEVLLQL
jgi:hypothetical protein